jgi:hypothetical protein
MSLMECVLGKWLRHRVAALVKGLMKGAPKPYRPRWVRPCLQVLEDRVMPAGTYLVTSLTDTGTGAAGTLSAAINAANANPNSTIDFDLNNAQGTPQTITVTGALPAITQPTIINGVSQGGENGSLQPWVELNGSQIAADGLTVNSGGVAIAGLAVDNFKGNGIVLNNPLGQAGDTLAAVNVGSGLNGTTVGLGNSLNGILITGGGNTISGGAPSPSVISGNGSNGIDIRGATAVDNVVQETYIGVDATGKTALANAVNGVFLEQGATGNTIGPKPGSGAGGNVISGNSQSGVYFDNANFNSVWDNDIGVGSDNLTQVANGKDGVSLLNGSSGNTIGASSLANVISGNTRNGVYLSGPNITGNLIQDDYIGVALDGKTPVANTANGVYLDAGSGPGNTVGGTNSAQTNVISGNGGAGVYLTSIGNKNLIAYNLIGTDLTGSVAVPNGGDGIDVLGSNNTIGANAPAGGFSNLISGNGDYGIELDGSSNVAAGNWIGTDSTGTAKLGNASDGVLVQGGKNTIGGNAPAGGFSNLISGNGGYGIEITGSSATNNSVNGNWIGTDNTGLKALGNFDAGVMVAFGANNTTIGAVQPVGTAPAPANVISGNGSLVSLGGGYGIWVASQVTGTLIEGDFIGLGVDGTTALGNVESGIRLGTNVSQTIIGGAVAGAGNTISSNGSDPKNSAYGVEIDAAASNNTIQGNNVGTNWQGKQGAQWQNKSGWRLDGGTNDTWIGNTTQPN